MSYLAKNKDEAGGTLEVRRSVMIRQYTRVHHGQDVLKLNKIETCSVNNLDEMRLNYSKISVI